MMNLIAWGLEVGHPAAYLLIFMIVGMPLVAIIINAFTNWFYNRKNK